MFISPAFAQAAGGGGFGGLGGLLPLILIFAVFYFLLIRPQQKKAKLHKEMLAAIRRGDRIVTGGGIVGTVTKVVDDNELTVEIAQGVKVRAQRGMVAAVLAKTEPVQDNVKPDAGTTPDGGSGGIGSVGSTLKKFLGGR